MSWPSSGGPRTLTCHVCGREALRTSMHTHLPQCAAQKERLQDWARTRGIGGGSRAWAEFNLPLPGLDAAAAEVEAYNAAAAAAYKASMPRCSRCGRTFGDEERLEVHLRSCKHPPQPRGRAPAAAASPAADRPPYPSRWASHPRRPPGGAEAASPPPPPPARPASAAPPSRRPDGPRQQGRPASAAAPRPPEPMPRRAAPVTAAMGGHEYVWAPPEHRAAPATRVAANIGIAAERRSEAAAQAAAEHAGELDARAGARSAHCEERAAREARHLARRRRGLSAAQEREERLRRLEAHEAARVEAQRAELARLIEGGGEPAGGAPPAEPPAPPCPPAGPAGALAAPQHRAALAALAAAPQAPARATGGGGGGNEEDEEAMMQRALQLSLQEEQGRVGGMSEEAMLQAAMAASLQDYHRQSAEQHPADDERGLMEAAILASMRENESQGAGAGPEAAAEHEPEPQAVPREPPAAAATEAADASTERASREEMVEELRKVVWQLGRRVPPEAPEDATDVCCVVVDVASTGARLQRSFRSGEAAAAVYDYVKWSIASEALHRAEAGLMGEELAKAHGQIMTEFTLVRPFVGGEAMVNERKSLKDSGVGRRDKFIVKSAA